MTTAVAPLDLASQQLVEKHYPLVRAIACRIWSRLPRAVELEDLISAGTLGLIEAVERFDTSRNVPFEPYAKHRIHGAIVDSLRATDWVPRSVRRKADQIESTRARLHNRHGRAPTRLEMAQALEIRPQKYDALSRDAQVRKLLSLDAPVGTENNTPLIEQIPGEGDLQERWEREELKMATVAAIKNLPERERTAIALYYLHELSLKEVGKVLGVTESRACQLCSQGIKRLRFRLRSLVS